VLALLIAAALGLLLSIFGTPYAIRVLRRREIGQFIQEDIKGQHAHKQGTPTMGGIVFVSAAVIGWLLAHVQVWTPETGITFAFRPFGPGGWLAVMTIFQTDDTAFAGWHYRRDPTHVVFYREETFTAIARHHDWRCEFPCDNVVLLQKKPGR